MATRLRRRGYEQIKAKWAAFKGRLAEIERRENPPDSQLQEARRSYREMMQRYCREIRIY